MSKDQDLPSFLNDSPFFLPVSNNDSHHHDPLKRPKPTIPQLIRFRTRRLRQFLLLFVILYALYLLSRFLSRTALYLRTPSCLRQDPVTPPYDYDPEPVNWTQYAYVQYATDVEYLCNSVMVFDSLWEKGSRAERVLMYPDHWSTEVQPGVQARLLRKARDDYGVVLRPVGVVSNHVLRDDWHASYTKLLSFNLTSYTRVLHLDSDSLIFRHMDELFLLPDSASPIAVPRAYWLAQPSLASHIMLLTPSSQTFSRITAAVESKAGHGYYDMEIINSLFSSSCSVLPHRTYSLLTGEFRRARNKHQCFLSKRGDGLGKPEWEEGWDPDRAGKLSGEPAWVHFSDYPLGKPWEREGSKGLWGKMMPGCWNEKGREVKWKEGEERDEEKEGLDCRERELWRGWYEDFWGRRERICGAE